MPHTNSVFIVQADVQTVVCLRERLASGEDPALLLVYASMPTLGREARTEIADLLPWSGLEPLMVAYGLALLSVTSDNVFQPQSVGFFASNLELLREDPSLRGMIGAALANVGWNGELPLTAGKATDVVAVLVDALIGPARLKVSETRQEARARTLAAPPRALGRTSGRRV